MTEIQSLDERFVDSRYERYSETEEKVVEAVREALSDLSWVDVPRANVHLHTDSIDFVVSRDDVVGGNYEHLEKLPSPVLERLREEFGLVAEGVMEKSWNEDESHFRVWFVHIPSLEGVSKT